jgi:hypothetical protein
VGVEEAVTPTVERVEPGDDVEVEVVSAGGAAEEFGGDGD